ncbi:MAG: transposase, partial [Brumimicrobium sp.]
MYNPIYHNRQSTRYRGYDYSSIGWYFVTINTKNRQCIFGEIHNSQMQLNELGLIIYDEWLNTMAIRDNIVLHEFIVMPNHIHGVIEIQRSKGARNVIGKFRSPSETLGAIVRGFKGAATKRVNAFCFELEGKHSPCVLNTGSPSSSRCPLTRPPVGG